MSEADYYPMGAYNDPRAPWNQKDPEMVECPECHGAGKFYYAYNFEKDEETECTEETWNLLPETEEEARAKRQHYIRGEVETCANCDGTGEVEEEYEEPEYDDDRIDFYREKDY